MCRIEKSIQIENRLVVASGWRWGELGVIPNGYGVSFGGDENVLKLNYGHGSQFCEYTENH